MTPIQAAELAHQIADRAVICDIECHAVRTRDYAERVCWYIAPMLDAREHAPEVIDMMLQAIDYALQRGLISRHPAFKDVVYINRSPA